MSTQCAADELSQRQTYITISGAFKGKNVEKLTMKLSSGSPIDMKMVKFFLYLA
jgi:sarcosine oxidase gamma subunit